MTSKESPKLETPNQESINFQKDQLGPSTWNVLHILGSNYPHKPTISQKMSMKKMIEGIINFYPCDYCREDFQKDMKKHPIKLSSKKDLSYWLCQRHNTVNKKLGKKLWNCKGIWKRWNYHTKFEEGKEFVESTEDCYGCKNMFGEKYDELKNKFFSDI